MKKPLKRKCPVCNTWFNPISDNHWICSYVCSIADKTEKQKAKIEKIKNTIWKKEKAEIKIKLMTHSDWIQKLQGIFNEFIRLRDSDLPCISCGTSTCDQWAAGHFIPTTYQIHRFNVLNVNKQCNQYCNMHLRGNLHKYRDGLIKKIGIEKVIELEETKHQSLDLSIPEIKELIQHYKLKIKQLKTQTL